jgi:hypothetical protein
MGQLLLLTHRIPSIRNTSKILNTSPGTTRFLCGLPKFNDIPQRTQRRRFRAI